MAKNDLDDLIKKLDRIENHLGEEIAPAVNKLLKESVVRSLVDWYNDYDPKYYKRTNNFMNVIANTRASGKKNIIVMTVDSGCMDLYPGFFGQSLQPSTAFDYMFMNGEHGHGYWMMHQSIPPYMYVEDDIYDGFGGRINKIMNSTIEKILKR
ncbi:MAG: hypothetical protein IJA10_10240 [Lachnospiraceae bacterium]|nr:hypothetical protein [Lachnospiraceae bacterium]